MGLHQTYSIETNMPPSVRLATQTVSEGVRHGASRGAREFGGLGAIIVCFNPIWIVAHVVAAAEGIHAVLGAGLPGSAAGALLVSGVPLVGTWFAVTGAHVAWGWSFAFALVVFLSSWIVFGIIVARGLGAQAGSKRSPVSAKS